MNGLYKLCFRAWKNNENPLKGGKGMGEGVWCHDQFCVLRSHSGFPVHYKYRGSRGAGNKSGGR